MIQTVCYWEIFLPNCIFKRLGKQFLMHGKWRHDTQHNDTQHNDIQHNDTQQLSFSIIKKKRRHSSKWQSIVMLSVTHKPYLLSVIMLNVVMLSVIMLSVMAPWQIPNYFIDQRSRNSAIALHIALHRVTICNF